ncbi:SH3 domain-containing C40 family peptidase [Exiguobacterium sp. N4-1P]|uniref:SH3 domain-containing C40 family peptidase n=1 Tax=Exiguobacterium sp. N4-1P TaxID=2051906 RepID=UPI001EF57DDD|nr:SH3 domain-containing C40 family peptidase [Exiguobacterium sp. N4-1P]
MKSYKYWFTSITASVMLLGSLPLQGHADTNPTPTEVTEQTETEQATGTQYTLSETPVFETADETTLVKTLPETTAVETFGTDGLFTRISIDGVYRFVKTTQLAKQPVYQKIDSQYITALAPSYTTASIDTPTGKSITPNTLIDTYGTSGDFTRIKQGDVYVFVSSKFLSKTPVYETTGTQFAQQQTVIYTDADTTSKQLGSYSLNATVKTYGTSGTFTRVQFNGVYGFVLTKQLGSKEVESYPLTGKKYAQQTTSIYDKATTSSVIGTLAPNQSVNLYGTSGLYSRVRINDTYGYVLTAHLGDSVVYAKTDRLYVQDTTPIQVEPNSSSTILKHHKQNTLLTIYGTSGAYSRIIFRGEYAYVLTSSLAKSKVYAKTDRLYIQKTTPIQVEPNSSSSVLKHHKQNTLLTIYGTSGAYSRIIFRGEYAYVLTSSLAKSKVYAKTDRLYIQKTTPIQVEPNSSSSVLKHHKQNTLLTIYGTSGAYSRIIFRGEYAYVLTSSLAKSKVYAKTDRLYIQKTTPIQQSPSSSSTVLKHHQKNTLLTIYGTSGAYSRIIFRGEYAYVLTSSLAATKADLYATTGTRYVTEDKLVVHPKASLSGNIGTLKKGALITTYGKSGYYTRVKIGSRFGFVDSSRLGLNKPTSKAKVGTVFYVHFNQTPLFSADVAYSRPASHLSKGTKLIGLKSIDDDFWQVRLPNGQTGYVLNPYIGTSKPDMRYNEQAINRSKVYTVKATTSFYDTPASPKSAGLVEKGKRVYPRYRVGNFYVIQSGWTPVYIPVTALTVTSETKVDKKNNSRGEKLIQAAVAHIGTPYTWGSQNVANGGFDCSGLIHYATNQAGKYGGRTNVRGYWYGAFFTNQRTSISSGKRSDIVFFENTYTDGPSHIGIMLDSKHFIHAGGSQLQISSIYEPHWREHFLGFKSM